jgi:acyl-CoA synthetase (AMP-forming)/AMP-acid ligase II
LIISGSQLSNGYLGQSKFQSFRTGDIGFCQKNIWYIQGRHDDVKKRNGIWTSPSEIEAAFGTTYSDEGEAVAVMMEDQAYVVCSDKASACDQFSREHMHQSGIPWNLIPIVVVHSKENIVALVHIFPREPSLTILCLLITTTVKRGRLSLYRAMSATSKCSLQAQRHPGTSGIAKNLYHLTIKETEDILKLWTATSPKQNG